jgi:multisubunit Na+/H+ antiporter MnhG subunit
MTERAMRTTLVLIGAFHLVLGAIALIAPETFFERIGEYAQRNDHYVGDVGSFYAASGIALLLAVRRPSWRVPLLVTGALWYGLHALNHAFDVGVAESDARGVADTVLLAVGGAGSAYLARVASRLRPGAGVGAED